MTHEQAFTLVAEICPAQAGWLWNTTSRQGCDTANAIADQYSEDEIEEARHDLGLLARGITPETWEAYEAATRAKT